MENRFKLKISRMFRSSFGSCRARNVPDVIEKPIFSPPENHGSFNSIQPPFSASPPPTKTKPFPPSICKPSRSSSCPDQSTRGEINHDCIMITPRETVRRRKVSSRYPPFLVSALDFDGRKCPPAVSPAFNIFSDCKDFGFYEKKKSLAKQSIKKKKKKKKKNNNKRVHQKSKNIYSTTTFFSSSSQESATNQNNIHVGGWWFSSEDETETLFSSRSLSSECSSEYSDLRRRRRQHSNDYRKRSGTTRRRSSSSSRAKNNNQMGVLPLELGTKTNCNNKVKDSFAVVKSSSDPYNDFRTSMVEMIVERQIFAAKDLEQLLQCFLSLNSHHHHRIIVEVFTEICETLFSNWS